MQSKWTRGAVAAAAVVAVVVLFIVLSAGGDEPGETTTTATTTEQVAVEDADGGGGADGAQPEAPESEEPAAPTIVVKEGEPVGGVQKLSFKKGDAVRFRVRSDVAEEVHVHGYDIAEDVEAGGTAKFDFPAEIEGVFEVELEHSATELAQLRVEP